MCDCHLTLSVAVAGGQYFGASLSHRLLYFGASLSHRLLWHQRLSQTWQRSQAPAPSTRYCLLSSCWTHTPPDPSLCTLCCPKGPIPLKYGVTCPYMTPLLPVTYIPSVGCFMPKLQNTVPDLDECDRCIFRTSANDNSQH